MDIKSAIDGYLKENGIEYYAVLDLAQLCITKPYLLSRNGIEKGCVIVFLVPYYSGECENISRYAAARDYHIFIKKIGDGLSAILSQYGAKAVAFGDHSPIDERDAAAKGGLGVIGENGLLINEKYGSYVFIGEVIIDMQGEQLGCVPPTRVEFCERCGMCRAACPKAEIGECLSALTQKKGEFSEREEAVIRKYGSAWGCDICSEVCPHNQNPVPTPIDFFHQERTPNLTSDAVLKMKEEAFAERAYSWRGREVVLRNLEILESHDTEK